MGDGAGGHRSEGHQVDAALSPSATKCICIGEWVEDRGPCEYFFSIAVEKNVIPSTTGTFSQRKIRTSTLPFFWGN